MKKFIGIFLSAALAVSMLAGCGGSSGSASDSKPAAEEAAEPAAEEAAEPAAEEAAEPAAEEAAEPAAEEASEPAAEEAAEGQTNTTAQADMGEKTGLNLSSMGSHLGGLAPIPEFSGAKEISADEVDEMDRAMRAYSPPEDSPLINNAENFYYYSQMNEDEQSIYDAMLMCASDPTTSNNITIAKVSMDPNAEDFVPEFLSVYFGMQYDHPELFWLYYGPFYAGVECNMDIYWYSEPDSDGTYNIYFRIPEPFEDFEERMEEFNDAVDTFMEDIDLSQPDDQIALQIHDKLINTVDYNFQSLEEEQEAQNNPGPTNVAHTAYAALVKDFHGTPTSAVCDGYAQAYTYLLQQAGIDAAVIIGTAGDAEDEEDRGGHAWSVVKLDDEWYESDSTWNDAGNTEIELEQIKETDTLTFDVLSEGLQDKDYRYKLEHYLYNLTTPEITEFHGSEYFDFFSSQGYRFNLASDSVHYRANDERAILEGFSKLMDLAPQATGTKYKLY